MNTPLSKLRWRREKAGEKTELPRQPKRTKSRYPIGYLVDNNNWLG